MIVENAGVTTTTQIQLDGLKKVYSRRGGEPLVAISDLSLRIGEGEFVSIIGPSGCGKTTLLRIIGGLLGYEGGSVTVNSQRVTSPSFDVAIVFQSFNLLPWRSLMSNVELGLEARKVAKKERRVRASKAVELVGLNGFEDYYPYQISGGMQQRVGLARALAIEPKILMMDEPFASVDAQTREKLQDELLRIWYATKKTVVFVTHSIEEAIYLSTRIVVLSRIPTKVVADISDDLPHPRNSSDVRTSPEFTSLRSKIWSLLQ